MKNYLILLLLVAAALSSAFAPKKKYRFSFPAEMIGPVQEEYAKQCEKGAVLYEMNCARCHSTKLKGGEVLPEFTQEQLGNYELRLANPQHVDSMTENTVSAEELGYISRFFNYRVRD